MSANQNPQVTSDLIQAELEAGFIEEIPDLPTAEKRWPKGIAMGKLGVVYAENRDPRLVLDSTVCGMNGRCYLPERQKLPNLRHISLFLSSCPAMQDQWQGASIDVKAAHKRMRIREEERGSLLFRFQNRLYAYRTAHFGAKTSAWHWGRVSAALLRLLHKFLFFRHAAWVYVDDFFFLFPESTAQLQYTLAIVLLRVLGTPLSWKKLEFEDTIEWNGWAIQPNMLLAHLPSVKHEKITTLILSLREHPSRKGLEKIIGIILWATSMVHHTRFLLTSLYRDLYSIPATNYSIEPTRWQEFLSSLNEDAIISQKNKLHLPVGARVVDFRHQTITSKSQLPQDVSIERHAWVRLRDPLIDKRKLSTESQNTLSWVQQSLLPMLQSIPLNRCSHMTIEAAADAFAHADSMGIGGWINIGQTRYWFSQLWNKPDLESYLPIHRELQRYISSWEALAQLCVILAVNKKCECRPGLISIQSGSDNTGAEANINHGFSTTEILSDIIKLVSTTQMQLNLILRAHHIPGEKNIEADDLSRGRTSNFDPRFRVDFQLQDIFAPMSFPKYLNNFEQWDTTIHPFAKKEHTPMGETFPLPVLSGTSFF